MVRLFSILLLTTFIGCASSKQFSHQDIIEEKSDDSGRVILKKYRQLISHPAHNKLATITQVAQNPMLAAVLFYFKRK